MRVDGKTEVRYRGPNVTPGYWRAPEQPRARPSTRKASSAPATPCSGSTRDRHPPGPEVRRPHRRGLQARHRHLRQRRARCARKIIAAGAPYVQDVVLTGLNLQGSRRADLPHRRRAARSAACPPTRRCRGAGQRAGARRTSRRVVDELARSRHRQRQPHRARAACWPSRRPSTRARSPTRARSTSAPCSSTATRWSRPCTTAARPCILQPQA